MHNAILALTWTKLSCRTSQNVTSYVTVYMCYICRAIKQCMVVGLIRET